MTTKKNRFKRRNSIKKTKVPNMASLLGHIPVNGDIGIEIEVEGNKFPKTRAGGWSQDVSKDLIPKQWAYTRDGSLRGQDNAEYVLAKPIKFNETDKAIDDLWDMFDKFGSVLSDSNRTSVHVHLNAQSWHLNRLTSFLGLYFCVEEILTEWCGDHRVGNLFCLRGRDATGIIAKLKTFIQNDGRGGLSEGLHYAGINCHALMKFGSVEIRALRGVQDKETVKTWVSILQRLYDMSGDYKDPRFVVEGFSGEGPMAFLQNILGPHYGDVIGNIPFEDQQLMQSLYEGVRLAQDLCYCRDWSLFEEDSTKPSPFGVRKRKSASLISVSEAFATYNTLDSVATVTSEGDE